MWILRWRLRDVRWQCTLPLSLVWMITVIVRLYSEINWKYAIKKDAGSGSDHRMAVLVIVLSCVMFCFLKAVHQTYRRLFKWFTKVELVFLQYRSWIDLRWMKRVSSIGTLITKIDRSWQKGFIRKAMMVLCRAHLFEVSVRKKSSVFLRK